MSFSSFLSSSHLWGGVGKEVEEVGHIPESWLSTIRAVVVVVDVEVIALLPADNADDDESEDKDVCCCWCNNWTALGRGGSAGGSAPGEEAELLLLLRRISRALPISHSHTTHKHKIKTEKKKQFQKLATLNSLRLVATLTTTVHIANWSTTILQLQFKSLSLCLTTHTHEQITTTKTQFLSWRRLFCATTSSREETRGTSGGREGQAPPAHTRGLSHRASSENRCNLRISRISQKIQTFSFFKKIYRRCVCVFETKKKKGEPFYFLRGNVP